MLRCCTSMPGVLRSLVMRCDRPASTRRGFSPRGRNVRAAADPGSRGEAKRNGRHAAPAVVSSGQVRGAGACQPQLWPSFCSFSQACSGAKYSSTAEASIFSPPVSSFMVFCHGWLAPLPSIDQ